MYYGRHNVSRKSVNHLWLIDFIAWRYFTPRRDVAQVLEFMKLSTLSDA